ncbi:hemolysin A [Spirochaeta thermophila DSM 6578]|uniref:Hemolysin A n=1 Tax=Winmispira thermophila (strain ATCC 700085 / DSM 6578 / Z-1203) TaxID=869211 RepID=G0GBQ2_WINT7|nr:TlyA family RNA methyltransferase [Spirochaeta thermophila]AEJ61130.1 hemolysin A [Spirochaeta thermophila DSM 6578]
MRRVVLLDLLASRFPDTRRDMLYAYVLCGEVFVDGVCVKDPYLKVREDVRIERRIPRYVSRGGYKLEAALHAWNLDIAGKGFLDVGASTGGFTECLLFHGAAFVHAVDVGYNQLAYKLRVDERVFVHERTNIREVRSLDPVPDAAVVDLSFRSLVPVAGHVLSLTREAWGIFLVKPQFEVVRGGGTPEGFRGVLKDREAIHRVVRETLEACAGQGFVPRRCFPSPVRGKKGNQEFLVLLTGEGEATGFRELEAWFYSDDRERG